MYKAYCYKLDGFIQRVFGQGDGDFITFWKNKRKKILKGDAPKHIYFSIL